MRNLQYLSPIQRRLVFFLIFGGGLLLLVAVTVLLAWQSLSSAARTQSVALSDRVAVREFAVLPDDDAYPAAVAAAPNGAIYTASYATGALWSVDAAGAVSEIAGSRDRFGAITGLEVTADGALLIVDQFDTDPRSGGGALWRMTPDGGISEFGAPPPERSWIAPQDVTADAAGFVYVTDAGHNEVWRFNPDGSEPTVWWASARAEGDAQHALNGLAYDATRQALVITDPEVNRIYRVAIADGATEVLYDHGSQPNTPGFDGAVVLPDGTLYVAALGQNGVVRVADGQIEYIAGLFRGASDLTYAAPDRLIVSNFDQSSLVLPLVTPQLPFALDEISLSPGA
jgi:streptogramin lyase